MRLGWMVAALIGLGSLSFWGWAEEAKTDSVF
jgi:hypothetical protein